MTNLILAKIGGNITVGYAFDELVRCLKLMDDRLFIDMRIYDEVVPERTDILWIGIDNSVERSIDDEIRIDVHNGSGIITGSNERAVLIAVYRFLYELGCRWLRPGDDSEIIPKRPLTYDALNVTVSEKASYRHRAVCIEGQLCVEHVLNMIKWIPRAAMNGYFLQYQTPSGFFRRWYNRTDNPMIPPAQTAFEDDDTIHVRRFIDAEILKRGLMYHAVGHGWTCEPIGIHGTSKDVYTGELTEEQTNSLAMVNGVRELWKGVALNTNLCYSNPDVRRKMVDSMVSYCLGHPEVDYLHFWLSDAQNNHCECENCLKHTPSDWYVQILNELDEAMTKAGVKTKIVFLLYKELLWKPQVNRIKNQDRFVLMFAPLSHKYEYSLNAYDRSKGREDVAPFVLNKIIMPRKPEEYLFHLFNWQDDFNGDSFDYEYHMTWAHFRDPGYMKIARVLHSDMVHLDNIGLNGMVDCQIHRSALPTGLPGYAMARALWDKTSDFDDIAAEYFSAAFGDKGSIVHDYLCEISRLLDMTLLQRGERDTMSEYADRAKILIDSFRDELLAEYADSSAQWKYLAYHAEMCMIYADLLKATALKDEDNKSLFTDKLRKYVRDIEPEIHNVFDPFFFEWMFNSFLKNL